MRSKSGKPLKTINEQMNRADLHPVSFWYQVKFIYHAKGKVEFKVRVKLRLRLQLHLQIVNHPPELHGYGSINFTGDSRVATPRQ